MPKAAYGEQLQTLDHLAASVPSDEPELSHLAPLHETLKDALKDIRAAKQRQLELSAAAQQATRDLEAAMERAVQTAAQLRKGLRGVYGEKSMHLISFGLRPHRSAWQKPTPPLPVSSPAAIPDGGDVPPSTLEIEKLNPATDPDGGTVPLSGPA